MPIEYLKTSIFDSPAQVLVNPVNSVGVMGAGLAIEFKKRWPEMFKAYYASCNAHVIQPGKYTLWADVNKCKVILNFPTKYHWRDPARLEYIVWGLESMCETMWIGQSIAFPKLGCGKGGLDWADVKPIMERYLGDLEAQVYIHT